MRKFVVCIEFKIASGNYSINNITCNELNSIVNAYKHGAKNFTISGTLYPFVNPKNVKFFEFFDYENFKNTYDLTHSVASIMSGHYYKNIFFKIEDLQKSSMCNDVTFQYLENFKYGEFKELKEKKNNYISIKRIQELSNINNVNFDLIKLIQFCKEINNAWQNENYLSVAVLIRALKDYIPPIFGFKNFAEIANNYGTSKNSSFSKSMKNLENSSKHISDRLIHSQIKKSETLPTETQVNFSQDLDVLLEEIIRVLK